MSTLERPGHAAPLARCLLVVFCVVSAISCTSTDADVETTESAYQISDGSPDAILLLQYVNATTAEELTRHVPLGPGIVEQAAQLIVTRRPSSGYTSIAELRNAATGDNVLNAILHFLKESHAPAFDIEPAKREIASVPRCTRGAFRTAADVTTDTVWTECIIRVYGRIRVAPGATLRIADGAGLETMSGESTLDVQGRLVAGNLTLARSSPEDRSQAMHLELSGTIDTGIGTLEVLNTGSLRMRNVNRTYVGGLRFDGNRRSAVQDRFDPTGWFVPNPPPPLTIEGPGATYVGDLAFGLREPVGTSISGGADVHIEGARIGSTLDEVATKWLPGTAIAVGDARLSLRHAVIEGYSRGVVSASAIVVIDDSAFVSNEVALETQGDRGKIEQVCQRREGTCRPTGGVKVPYYMLNNTVYPGITWCPVVRNVLFSRNRIGILLGTTDRLQVLRATFVDNADWAIGFEGKALHPDTFVYGSNFLRNGRGRPTGDYYPLFGALARFAQVRTDHHLGVLALDGNYWGEPDADFVREGRTDHDWLASQVLSADSAAGATRRVEGTCTAPKACCEVVCDEYRSGVLVLEPAQRWMLNNVMEYASLCKQCTPAPDFGKLELGPGRGPLSIKLANGRSADVCRQGFDARAAQVACRQLNKPWQEASVDYSSDRMVITDPQFDLDGSCDGTEDSLLECGRPRPRWSSVANGSCSQVFLRCAGPE